MERQSEEELAAQTPFIDAILADPDELSNYQVFSDWLIERGDPRGDLINIQLQLASAKVVGNQREALAIQEKELIQKHARLWMPEALVPYLIDEKPSESRFSFSFSKGFLDFISFDIVTDEFLESVAKSDLRLLGSLSIGMISYGGNPNAYKILGKGEYDNLRSLSIGNEYPAEVMHADQFVRKMPRIETIAFETRTIGGIFNVPMENVRSLSLEASYGYPIEELAANKTLGKLESIHILPHADDGDAPYITLESFKAFCKADHFTSLNSISFELTELGNEGIKHLLSAPFWPQLTSLNLSNGTMQEEGALLLAKQDLSRFKKLDLSQNYISPHGVAELKKRSSSVKCGRQFEGDIDDEMREHLWEGSPE